MPCDLCPARHFLALLHQRCAGCRFAPLDVLDAVAVLTSAADPDRNALLRPRLGEPPVLIQRLAVWALRQVDDTLVTQSLTFLQPDQTPSAGPAPNPARHTPRCRHP